jgi:flagellar biosynthesis protein FlhA
VQSVLQLLLSEGVSIRDLVTVAETLADRGRQTKDVETLTEAVRGALARQITVQHRARDGALHALTLHPMLERQLAGSLQQTDTGTALVIEPALLQLMLAEIARQLERTAASGDQPVLLTSSRIRRPLRRLTERSLPVLPVVAFNEVASEVDVRAVGTVEVDAHAAAAA